MSVELPKIEIKNTFYNLQIFIDSILHVSLRTENGIQLQSYISGDRKIYCIDFYSGGQEISCEYGRKDIWEEILKQLVEQKIA